MTEPNRTPAADELGPGTVIDGRYRIVRELGQGGMGTVYAAEQVILGKQVAIKVMLAGAHGLGANSRKRFAREARILSSIKHRNVVGIIDFGELADETTYYVMELLEGRDLSSLIETHGPQPWPRSRKILHQALGALGAAHDKGIIHRDIKPANIMVLDGLDQWGNEWVKVLDFGIAKLQSADEESQALTGTSEILGTARFMAPELILGQPPDARTDLYAMGIVAYRLLTGVTPFQSENTFKLLTQHLQEAPPPLRRHVPSIPSAVEAFVLRALAKKPEDRHQTAAQMQQALEELGDSPPEVVVDDQTLHYQDGGTVVAPTMIAPLSPAQPVSKTVAMTSPPAGPPAGVPPRAPQQHVPTPPYMAQARPRSNTGVVVALVAVLVIMAGVAVGLFL